MKKILLLILLLPGIVFVLVKGYTLNRDVSKGYAQALGLPKEVDAQDGDGSMQPVANDPSHLYYKDAKGVYIFNPRACGFVDCTGPDTRPFKEKYLQIPEADPATFQILNSLNPETASTGEILARDREHVFYGGRYVPTGDVNTLEVVGEYGKDKNYLYFRGSIIEGVDTATIEVLGRDLIADRNGLYIANASPPRVAALIDRATFKLWSQSIFKNNRDYIAEDKNFYYFYAPAGYGVDAKPNVADFKKLGCSYYYFKGRIFHSVYRISDADVATFRVLGGRDNSEQDTESCMDFYAIDKNHRYEFEYQIRPDDDDRNHEIDLLLAKTPADKKSLSRYKLAYSCIPQDRPGVNFGYSPGPAEVAGPGTIRFLIYSDADILEAQIINASGQWQPLPQVSERAPSYDCDSVQVERFHDINKKPWFSRRDPKSISLVVNSFGQDPIFIVADSGYSIKLLFSKSALIAMLQDALTGAGVTPFAYNAAGWGSGWILEDKLFLNREQIPEVWLPLRIKNGPGGHKEGRDFVTVGFRYSGGQFECIDAAQCSFWKIPQRFKAMLK